MRGRGNLTGPRQADWLATARQHSSSLPSLIGFARSPRELLDLIERIGKAVRFGRKPKLSPYQRTEAIKRRAAGETLASIAKSYAVDISMISRLKV